MSSKEELAVTETKGRGAINIIRLWALPDGDCSAEFWNLASEFINSGTLILFVLDHSLPLFGAHNPDVLLFFVLES